MSASKEASPCKDDGGIPDTEWTAGSSYSSLYLNEQQEPLDLSMKHKPADSVLTMMSLSDNIKVDLTDDQLVSENDTSSRRNGECASDLMVPHLEKFPVSRIDVDDNPSRRNSMATNDESRQQSSDSTPDKSKDATGEDALGQERRFLCQLMCGYSSKYKSDVKKHERIHTGAKPFVCSVDQCAKCFSDSSTLVRHLRIHTGEKSFVCSWAGCEKRFSRSSTLTEHTRIHKGEKPYACTWNGCAKRFTTNSNLHKHKKTHTREDSYTCTIENCGQRFAQSSDVTEHTQLHHGQMPCVGDISKQVPDSSDITEHKEAH